MEADTTLFQASNGRQPRGFGRWGFQVGNETHFIVGQYRYARQDAFKIAQTRGEERVIVLPGKELVPQGGNPERPEKLNQEQINNIKERLMAQGNLDVSKGEESPKSEDSHPGEGHESCGSHGDF